MKLKDNSFIIKMYTYMLSINKATYKYAIIFFFYNSMQDWTV